VNGSATAATTLTTSLFASGSVGLYDFSPTTGFSAPRGQVFDNVVISDDTPAPAPGALSLLAFGLLAARRLGRR
jgi:MYXO-CTERM domain-containing protein